jgi:hypothetical protein
MTTLFEATNWVLQDEIELLHNAIAEQIYSEANPLPYCVAALIATAGGRKEISHYCGGHYSAHSIAKKAFMAGIYNTAQRMLTEHPKLFKEIHSKKIAKKRIKGPLKKASAKKKAFKTLGFILTDTESLTDYISTGYFDWDNGDYLAALFIALGWTPQLINKIRFYELHGRPCNDLIRILPKKFPDHELLKWAIARYKASFYYLFPEQKKQIRTVFSQLASKPGKSEKAKALQLIGASSLIDFGIRFKQPELIEEAAQKIANILEKQSIPVTTAFAWAQTLRNNKEEATHLALQVSEEKKENYILHASKIFKANGNIQKSNMLLKRIHIPHQRK